jgi:hypothetical protein
VDFGGYTLMRLENADLIQPIEYPAATERPDHLLRHIHRIAGPVAFPREYEVAPATRLYAAARDSRRASIPSSAFQRAFAAFSAAASAFSAVSGLALIRFSSCLRHTWE